MKKYVVIIGLICMVLSAMAQNPREVDSLRKALKGSKLDTNRISLQLKIGDYYLSKAGGFKDNLDSAYQLFYQANQLSVKLREPGWQYKSVGLIGDYYFNAGNPDLGKKYMTSAINYYHQKGDVIHEADSWSRLGDVYDDNGKNYSAQENISYYQHAYTLYVQSKQLMNAADVLVKMADIQRLDRQFEPAEKNLQKALAQYKLWGHKNFSAVYRVFYLLEYGKGNYYRAMTYASEAIQNMKISKDTTSAALYYQFMARSNFVEKKYNEALQWIRKAISADKGPKIFPYKTAMIQTLIALNRIEDAHTELDSLSKWKGRITLSDRLNFYRANGLYYDKINKNDISAKYYTNILGLITIKDLGKENYDIWSAICNNEIAGVYLKTNQAAKAKKYIANAASTLKNTERALDPRFLLAFYDNLYKYNVATDNYRAAVKTLEKHDSFQDSLFTVDKNNKVAELDIQYQTAQKEQSIKGLHDQAAIQQAGLEKANLLKNETFAGIVLVLIIACLLYRQSRLRKKSNNIITKKNAQLQNLVTEKEWLLKEVHHRVKNNLHSVISLLEAQASYLENDALKAIENSQHRIYAMSLIHQKLYQSDDIKTIDMTVYIPELVQYLRDSFDISGRIYCRLDIQAIQLNPAQAIPLGLIINEALTNSIKYAFPNGRSGEITVSLIASGTNYQLDISDNGVGINKKTTARSKSSLGLELMKGLAKEIKGEIKIETGNGVRIIIVFERDWVHDIDQQQVGYLVSV